MLQKMRASAKPCRYSTPLSDRPERRRIVWNARESFHICRKTCGKHFPAKTKQVFHKFKWKLWKAKENTSVLFPIAGKSGGKRAARRSICPDSHGNRSLSPPLSAPPESTVRHGKISPNPALNFCINCELVSKTARIASVPPVFRQIK